MFKNKKIVFFYIIVSLLLTVNFFGIYNLSFTNFNWLTSKDQIADLTSWYYFKNDIWRFPLGSNPNFGLEIGSGMVFSGAIPIFAIIFKIFSSLLPDNFHYFTIWIYVCFFLQGYLAYLIIKKLTKNDLYSIIGSIFFIISPILITRMSMHISLAAHWVILYAYYIQINNDIINKKIYWSFLISISSLIHFYFTVMLLGMYCLFIFNKHLINLNLKKLFLDISIPLIFLVIVMFISGFFHVPFTDSMGFGYGTYKMNLASIINPLYASEAFNLSWSSILPNLPYHLKGEVEGFNYLGVGGIILCLWLFYFFIKKPSYFLNISRISYILIIILFSLYALSNKVSFLDKLIFDINLHDIVYGIFSITRASGRFFWPIFYLIFILSSYLIYKNFSKKTSITILSLVLIIQIIDIFPGLKKNTYNFKNDQVAISKIDKDFWNELAKDKKILRTTHLKNETGLIIPLRLILFSQFFEKTDISRHGRYNRKKASIVRSDLYKSFNDLEVDNKSVFIIDNKNHLRNLKFLFRNLEVGFFLRDDLWVLINNNKNKMNTQDFINLEQFQPINIKQNIKYKFSFINQKSIHGLGWSQDYQERGIWTEGNISTILFKYKSATNKKNYIDIKIASFIKKNDNPIKFIIELNNKEVGKYSISNLKDLDNIRIDMPLKKSNNDIYLINIKVINPITPLELLQSPDGRKLGLLVESLEITKN
jgi:hypothetical protein